MPLATPRNKFANIRELDPPPAKASRWLPLMGTDTQPSPEQIAQHVRQSLPAGGLFAGHQWRVATQPFPLDKKTVQQLEQLGRVLLKFYQAANTIYRWSAEGRLPAWPSAWLDRGKPQSIIDLQRSKEFRAELPRVIRPDILLADDGPRITELDSVPGGIGLTAWLNRAYTGAGAGVLGGATGMLDGFAGIFGDLRGAPLVPPFLHDEGSHHVGVNDDVDAGSVEFGDGAPDLALHGLDRVRRQIALGKHAGGEERRVLGQLRPQLGFDDRVVGRYNDSDPPLASEHGCSPINPC